jgi:hypothetical protein
LCLKKPEIEWAAIHVGYVAIVVIFLLVKFATVGWHCITTWFLSGIQCWEHRCQVSGFDKDDLHLATLAPGVTMPCLGILSCAFLDSLYLLALFGL